MACRRIVQLRRRLLHWPLVGPTRATARRASVSSTEASDGRLARVGRIAASAFMSGAAGLLSGRSRAPVGTAQHVALGNNLATALAMSSQRDYNMSSL